MTLSIEPFPPWHSITPVNTPHHFLKDQFSKQWTRDLTSVRTVQACCSALGFGGSLPSFLQSWVKTRARPRPAVELGQEVAWAGTLEVSATWGGGGAPQLPLTPARGVVQAGTGRPSGVQEKSENKTFWNTSQLLNAGNWSEKILNSMWQYVPFVLYV